MHNRRRMVHRLLVPLLLLLSSAVASADSPCALTQRWNEDPPYSMKMPDGHVGGITVDVVRMALGRMGCSAVLVEMPWARAMAELQAGRLDILPGMLRSPEREVFAHFAMERANARNVLFAHVDAQARWPRQSLDEILHSDFKLGAQIGVNYGQAFVALDRDPAFHRVLELGASRMRLWQMLKLRRIDGLIADEWTARYELAQLGMQDSVRATGLVITEEAAGIAFGKASVKLEFVQRFDAILASMERDGSYRAIVQKYVLTDGAPPPAAPSARPAAPAASKP